MIELLIAALIVLPALILAVRRSNWLLDYAIFVLAYNRGIRRLVDYYINGHFNQFSLISLTPLLTASLLLVPAFLQFTRLSPRAQVPFRLLGWALGLGFLVGVISNKFAAVYSLAEWLSALGAMAFAATQPATREVADRWIKSTGWAAVGVALYGWWQYYTIPPWDAMWLVESGMAGYMGSPEPTLMTVFSTLNERGPCGGFLAWAVIPMIVDARWRNVGGWLSVALLISVIVLAETRSNLIIIAMVAFIYPALARGRSVGRLLMLSCLVIGVTAWGMEKVPGLKRMKERFGSESLYGEGSSLQGRLSIYHFSFGDILSRPQGLGLGSSGMGQRTVEGAIQTVGDSGYLQIFAQFGWIGAGLFFAALWQIWTEVAERWRVGLQAFGIERVDSFIPATRAILLGSLAFLFVGDIFAGFSLLWVFFGRALSPSSDSQLLVQWLLRKRLLEKKQAALPSEGGRVG